MSFENISDRLTALQESNNQLKDLIERLGTLGFQPGSVPLDEDENVMTELSSEIHQTLRDQDEDFELLQEEVYDLDSGRIGSELEQEKERLDSIVKRCIKELKALQTAFRKAQLTARRNLQAAKRTERTLLLQSYVEPHSSNTSPIPGPHQRRHNLKPLSLTKEEKEVSASSDITLALRRTHALMASELSRSQFAHDTLKESTAALAQLSETYSTLDTMLARSRNLLGTLLTSQKSDTWYLETAFYVLLTTIAWLVWRRLLYGPTWWLVWFPLKMFIKGWLGVFTALGLRGGGSVSVRSGRLAEGGGGDTVALHGSGMGSERVIMTVAGPPSVNDGEEGKEASMKPAATPGAHGSEESVSDQVGRIIGESQEGQIMGEGYDPEIVGEERDKGDKANPMKRMWEEDKEAAKAGAREKDEL